MWTAVFSGPEILSLPNDGDICNDIPNKHRGSEIRMSVIRFLLEYTVNHVFGGNKSQCARELGMTYNYFSKIYRRTSEGSYSIRLVEDLLLLFMRMDISLDDCLREYTQSQRGKRIEDMESSCVKAYERIQGSISHMQSEAQDVTDLMRAAREHFQTLAGRKDGDKNRSQNGNQCRCARLNASTNLIYLRR